MAHVLASACALLQSALAQMVADAERAKEDAVKNHPDFKELSGEVAGQVRALGIEAFYNTEEVVTGGKYGGKTWTPFSKIFLKDRAGKNGRVCAVKEILKARLGAVYCSDVRQGANKYGIALG